MSDSWLKKCPISIKSKDGLEALVDPRFGRAHAFVIVELETREIVAQFFNDAAAAAHGAGIAATVFINSNHVDAVISGRFGPKAFAALAGMGITVWIAPPNITARQALELFRLGELERMQLQVFR